MVGLGTLALLKAAVTARVHAPSPQLLQQALQAVSLPAAHPRPGISAVSANPDPWPQDYTGLEKELCCQCREL